MGADPGLGWPAWCLADGESYTLDALSRYDFRGVSVEGCTPLPFTFRYEYLCSSDDDCAGGFASDVPSGQCINLCPDADGDGWTTCAGDCADGDPNRHPGRNESCSTGVDDDCDGAVNEGCGGGGGKIHFEQQ